MKTLFTLFAICICNLVFAQSANFNKIENEIKANISKGKWDEVMIQSTDLLVEEPTRGDGYYYTALSFFKLGQPDKAKEYLDKAEAIADNDLKTKIKELRGDISSNNKAQSIIDNANKQAKSGNNKMAADEWKKLWELDKTKTDNALNAVELYIEEKKYPIALEILNDPALAKDDNAKNLAYKLNETAEMKSINGYNISMKLGEANFNKNDYPGAILHFDDALIFKPNEANAIQFKKRAQDEQAWLAAKKENTITSYENYVGGRTLKKYQGEAEQIIKNALIQFGQDAATAGNIAEMENYLNKYLNVYPNGDATAKAKAIMCSTYLKEADKFKLLKTASSQQNAIENYKNVTRLCPDAYNLKNEISAASKKLVRYGRPDRTFIAYLYDSITPFGITIGGIKNRRVGTYIAFRMNETFITKAATFTVDNTGRVDGTSYTTRSKNSTRNGMADAIFGFTKKITYPLWIYVGGGVTMYQQYWEMDTYLSNGTINETHWVKNTDEKWIKPVIDAGLIVDLKGLHLRAGVKSTEFKGVNYCVGFGFSFK